MGGSNDQVSGDGGTLSTVYEKGSKLGLEPLDYGDPSLVGLWSFEEGSSSIAYDYSGSNATGTWNGAATGTAGYYSAGKVGSWAGAFDGATNYVDVPNGFTEISGSNNFTMVMWINPTAATLASQPVLIYANGSGGNGYYIQLSGTTGLYWANNTYRAYSGLSILANAWTQIAVVKTGPGDAGSLYVNGVGYASYTGHIGNTQAGTYDWYLGKYPPGLFYQGLLDDVRVYNRPLSASEIATMYAWGK